MADRAKLTRRLRILTVITGLCYLIGYPVALVAHSAVGWVFVALGGPLLLALLGTVVQRIHLDSLAERGEDNER